MDKALISHVAKAILDANSHTRGFTLDTVQPAVRPRIEREAIAAITAIKLYKQSVDSCVTGPLIINTRLGPVSIAGDDPTKT